MKTFEAFTIEEEQYIYKLSNILDNLQITFDFINQKNTIFYTYNKTLFFTKNKKQNNLWINDIIIRYNKTFNNSNTTGFYNKIRNIIDDKLYTKNYSIV